MEVLWAQPLESKASDCLYGADMNKEVPDLHVNSNSLRIPQSGNTYALVDEKRLATGIRTSGSLSFQATHSTRALTEWTAETRASLQQKQGAHLEPTIHGPPHTTPSSESCRQAAVPERVCKSRRDCNCRDSGSRSCRGQRGLDCHSSWGIKHHDPCEQNANPRQQRIETIRACLWTSGHELSIRFADLHFSRSHMRTYKWLLTIESKQKKPFLHCCPSRVARFGLACDLAECAALDQAHVSALHAA